MPLRSVYIITSNRGTRLTVRATLNEWDGSKIVAVAEVEDLNLTGIEQPPEGEYRQWVSMVARMGSRAIEDALMMRTYKGTAADVPEFKKCKDDAGAPAVQDQ